ETQVVAFVMCSDQENDADILAINGASLSLLLSDIPFTEAVSGVRVSRVDGQIVINPTLSQLEVADYEFVVAGTKDSIVMVEGESREISEAEFLEALKAAAKAIAELCAGQVRIVEAQGPQKPKRTEEVKQVDPNLLRRVEEH